MFLNQAEIEFFLKDQIYALLQKEKRIHVLMAELQVMNLDEKLTTVLMEMITANSSLQKKKNGGYSRQYFYEESNKYLFDNAFWRVIQSATKSKR